MTTASHIQDLIRANNVVLFMKGTREQPQCGFSASVVEMLDQLLPTYTTVNVLADPEIREGIKVFSNWPTIPQLYVRGEFIGGCDITKDLYAKGELHKLFGLTQANVENVHIQVSDAAKKILLEALKQADEGEKLRIEIDSRFEHGISITPKRTGDLELNANGLSFWIDLTSASRANGLMIDYVEEENESGFKLDNPNMPKEVQELSVEELKRWQGEAKKFNFIDVREMNEWERGRIPGARLMLTMSSDDIKTLDKNTPLVFHCRSGGRSKRKAEEFRHQGFKEVYNLTGGIKAWRAAFDPSIPEDI